ncbi:MAG: hypothetical protein WD468_06270 [Pirellulales bacterium]
MTDRSSGGEVHPRNSPHYEAQFTAIGTLELWQMLPVVRRIPLGEAVAIWWSEGGLPFRAFTSLLDPPGAFTIENTLPQNRRSELTAPLELREGFLDAAERAFCIGIDYAQHLRTRVAKFARKTDLCQGLMNCAPGELRPMRPWFDALRAAIRYVLDTPRAHDPPELALVWQSLDKIKGALGKYPPWGSASGFFERLAAFSDEIATEANIGLSRVYSLRMMDKPNGERVLSGQCPPSPNRPEIIAKSEIKTIAQLRDIAQRWARFLAASESVPWGDAKAAWNFVRGAGFDSITLLGGCQFTRSRTLTPNLPVDAQHGLDEILRWCSSDEARELEQPGLKSGESEKPPAVTLTSDAANVVAKRGADSARVRRAAASFEWVCTARPELVPAEGTPYTKEMWESIRDNGCAAYCDENGKDLPVPSWDTWSRYLREHLKDTRAIKTAPRAGRPHGKTVVRKRDL